METFARAIPLLAVALAACGPGASLPPRAELRGAVLGLAEGVRAADVACAELARARHDLPLAEACGASYQGARAALLAAESALDDGELARVGCEAAPAVARLQELARRLDGPRARVEDALALAGVLARLTPCPDGGRS